MALKKVGPPKKKKREKEKQKNLAPFHYALCVTLTLSHALLYTLTYVVQHTHTHIYIYTNVIYIYKHREVLQTWSSESCQRRQRPSWKTLRTKWWWFTAQSLISIVSFIKTSNGTPRLIPAESHRSKAKGYTSPTILPQAICSR